ncbi:MAG: hypothetical protein NTX00_00315 [Candidatus Parcubacteria bacterium]|nr:hypothetical protein [Candidatus Parcubacteria bacterium]
MTQEEKALEERNKTIEKIIQQLSEQIKVFGNTEEQFRAHGVTSEDVARVHTKLGYFLREKGKIVLSRLAFKQALRLNPKNTWAKNQLAAL